MVLSICTMMWWTWGSRHVKHFYGHALHCPRTQPGVAVQLGLALLMGNLMDATFALFFLKQVLGHEVHHMGHGQE